MSRLPGTLDGSRSDIAVAASRPEPIVVGIGASSGGLDAVTLLLEAWQGRDHALVLVQHADPSAPSMMAALLAPHTTLAVREAADGMAIEAGHLYVMPPGRTLSVSSGRLRLSTPPSRQSARLPFDGLLHALARAYGERACCVVLSGTGADGTAGLASIKSAGGLVAVQDPEEAAYGGMPASAIATGLADLVLPVAAIPAALSRAWRAASPAADHARPDHVAGADDGAEAEEGAGADGVVDAIIDHLRAEQDGDFTGYKPGTLGRRIDRRVAQAGLAAGDRGGYLARLRADPRERQALARDLLIHVTRFFRDGAVFDTLAASTIPALVSSHPEAEPIRVWVAGCSSGEETYSLAILFLERIEAAGRPLKLQVFASDIDPGAIATAREGTYPLAIAHGLAPARLARFFMREEGGWRAAPELRATVVFTVHDVLTDPPFSRLDMVSCRNLLIYLRPEAQARVLDAFGFALREGGILLLGSAETALAPGGAFEPVSKADRIYRRAGPARLGPGVTPTRGASARPPERRPRAPPLAGPSASPAALAALGRRLVLDAYAPASVLVDAADTVLFSLGPVDAWLRLPAGHATQDLLAMARPGLRNTLRAALAAARDTGRDTHASGSVIVAAAPRPFDIAVRHVAEAGRALLLVSFLDAPVPRDPGPPMPGGDMRQIAELQRELEATRAELQGSVRDLELSGEEQRAINEEALSVNEEYQSTNEELVASKEELQSLNEELTAVNSQLQETLERQRTTSDDLQNVLYSSNVATLFLDLGGRIRFFTPAVQALFALKPDDVGREISDFASRADDAALAGDLDAARRGEDAPDREIETARGDWFRRRILPYRAGDGGVGGVVITWTDVTARRKAGRALEAAKMDAEAANAAKSRFLAAASHDLRQPLQTLALLQALLADTVTGTARDLVARQTATLGNISDMLDSLLDINEIEAGVVQPEIADIALGAVLGRLRTEFAVPAEAKNLALRVVPSSCHVRTDAHLLEQILRNLLSNAIKYTEQGRVLLGCRRRGGRIDIELWDTGIGIAPSALTAIFEEYVQLGNPARARGGGLGLGLSIVKRLADLLGHPVRVRSRPGRGSVFAIELPLVPPPPPTGASAPAAAGAANGAACAILVVEDDPDLGETLAAVLRGAGHAVTVVADGPAALGHVAAGTAPGHVAGTAPGHVAGTAPGLLIADYNLPNGPNGLALAALIRDAVGAPLPALILTGDISNATARAATQAGCATLTKPASFPALLDAIARLLAPPGLADRVVFVVDDDDDVRSALTDVLEADGRAVAGFPSAEAFLERFRDRDGDCLLVDAALPGISGIDLLERLRAGGHHLPAIVITGQSDVGTAIRAMKAGAADFIEKPVGRPALLASIAHALEGSRDAAEITARADAAAARIAGLTPRQREIMTLVLAGHPSKNIAADLGISRRTVENHRASIMHRTGAASLPALARLALAAAAAA